jgi:hypothetical protein
MVQNQRQPGSGPDDGRKDDHGRDHVGRSGVIMARSMIVAMTVITAGTMMTMMTAWGLST